MADAEPASAASPSGAPASTAPAAALPTTPPPPAHAPTTAVDPSSAAPVSASDDGTRKRPRDARLIHMILANQGVTAYAERVPLQLLDFCYRYTSAALQDALHLTGEFGQSVSDKGKVQGAGDLNAVSLASLRLSIASRTHYQLSAKIGKEHLTELAHERNKVALPPVGKDWGFRLPPERYVLGGIGWGLREEWDSEGEEDGMEVDGLGVGLDGAMAAKTGGDLGVDGRENGDEEDEEDEEGGRMEDLYGPDTTDMDRMDTKDE